MLIATFNRTLGLPTYTLTNRFSAKKIRIL